MKITLDVFHIMIVLAGMLIISIGVNIYFVAQNVKKSKCNQLQKEPSFSDVMNQFFGPQSRDGEFPEGEARKILKKRRDNDQKDLHS